MEERLVLSHTAVLPPVAAQVAATPNLQVSVPISIQNINVTSITRDATTGVLTAVGTLTGTLLGHQFTTPITAIITPPTGTQTCPILDLSLAPIHLDLLGLKVDTSAICLSISATPGEGNLLGNLLCGTTGLLDNLISDVTSAVNAAGGGTLDLTTVLGDLNSILGNTQLLGGLNTLLGQATQQFGSPSVTPATPAATSILDLSLGPVDLNLLGLNVHLDNCANGPVTVMVSAQPGAGKLLGNLLSGVAHLLDSPGNPLGGILSHLRGILGIAQNAPTLPTV